MELSILKNNYLAIPLTSYLFPLTSYLLPLPFYLFPLPYSLLPIPYSLLPIPYSLLPLPYSLLPFSAPSRLCDKNQLLNSGQTDTVSLLKVILYHLLN